MARQKTTGEEDLKMDGRGGEEECDGLRSSSATAGSKVQQERLQGQAGGLPQTTVASKGNQERTEMATEATGDQLKQVHSY